MEQAPQLMVLFGSLISLLLSVVAYFIKQLHTDFKRMEKDLVEVKTMALLIKTEFKSSSDLLNQKVDYLEHRVQKLEINIFKYEIIKMCLERILGEVDDVDEEMGVFAQNSTTTSFKLAFNTLIKYKILIEELNEDDE